MKRNELTKEQRAAAERLTEVRQPLLDWYEENMRALPWRENTDPYRVWVSEIMLQQTRVEAGKAYFERFIEELPEVRALANVTDQQLMKLWEGLGYYSRARNLKKAAGVVMEQFGGSIPASYEELLKLPGIGPYTAGAVASISFGIAAPAVDGNVLRVISRILASEADIADARTKKSVEAILVEVIPQDHPGEFNQALMELGAIVCLPNGAPKCEECPAAPFCRAREQERCLEIPVKKGKKERRVEERTVLVLMTPDGKKVALQRRPEKGLLAGLYELPNAAGRLDLEGAVKLVERWGISAAEVEPLGEAKHIFSHVEWRMVGFRIVAARESALPQSKFSRSALTLATEQQGLFWVSQEELSEEYALPSAFRAYRDRIWKER